MTVTRRLARYARGLRGESLPSAVVDKVRLCVLDALGCALTARDLPWSRQAVAWVRALGARAEASVIGSTVRTAAAEAAFANAVQAHGLVQEDMHPASACHIGVVVIPAALAVAESTHARGADVVAAIVAGYQAMGRLGRVIIDSTNARIFRPTGMLGPVAAALTASRLLALDEDATVNALGLAGNLATGLNEWPHTGGTEVFFHAGFAARHGVVAASLAAAGMVASESIVDGEAGMIAAYGGRDRATRLDADLTDGFEILDVYHKPAPACHFAQTPCQAALEIVRTHRVVPADVESVAVASFPAAVAYPGCDHAGPFSSILHAKMSIQFGVASVLARGELDDESFRRFDDAETARIAARVTLRTDPEFTRAAPSRQGAEVTVRLRDGRTLTARLDTVRPLGPGDVRTRFRKAAARALGDARAAKIEETVSALVDLDDVAALTRLLAPEESR